MSLYHRRLVVGFVYTGIPMLLFVIWASSGDELAGGLFGCYGFPLLLVGLFSLWAAFDPEPKRKNEERERD